MQNLLQIHNGDGGIAFADRNMYERDNPFASLMSRLRILGSGGFSEDM
jgi:hypothetical protein